MKKNISQNEQIWKVIFIVVPTVILIRISNQFAVDFTSEILYSGISGVIGALLGAGAFQLVKKLTIIK
jgi:hypothetical protein